MKETNRVAGGFQAPFNKEDELLDSDVTDDQWRSGSSLARFFRPSQQSISLGKSEVIRSSLEADLCSTRLDQLAPYIWLVSTPVHSNITPLHAHGVHNRAIILTEDPALHLVWVRGRIFIKPLPAYLLSHQFWTSCLLESQVEDREHIKKAALGFLRSYYYLIMHPSDLRVAQRQDLQLVPPNITWEQWCSFSASFCSITNSAVSPRYHYGKLQLPRLNWLMRIFMRQLDYYYLEGTYSDYFARFYGPLLFMFGVLSVLLSAMQVGMAVEAVESRQWTSFWTTCRWFSVACLAFVGFILTGLIAVFTIKSLDETIYTVRSQWLKRWRKGVYDNQKAKSSA